MIWLLFPSDVQAYLLRQVDEPPPGRIRLYGSAYGAVVVGLVGFFIGVVAFEFSSPWKLLAALFLGSLIGVALGRAYPKSMLRIVRPLFVRLLP
jgi:hypothetical protein